MVQGPVVVDEMEELVLAFQGLSLPEIAQQDALIKDGGAEELEAYQETALEVTMDPQLQPKMEEATMEAWQEAWQETMPEVAMDPKLQQKIEQVTMEAYQEACEFEPRSMGAPFGGAGAEVTGLRIAGPYTELAQAGLW